ncbi:MAG: hypothetical protein PHI68_08765 [Candidatus Cloacimonetes bacterium]|nr:hypothetical protein [Candidatus Cloacimonadota bacterium]
MKKAVFLLVFCLLGIVLNAQTGLFSLAYEDRFEAADSKLHFSDFYITQTRAISSNTAPKPMNMWIILFLPWNPKLKNW